MTVRNTPRMRSARAQTNDRALRTAAVREINRVGVDHISLRDVSHQAGLTHGATYGRFENVDELLVDLWNSTLHDRLSAMFELCLAAVQDPNTTTIGAVFDLLRDADDRDRAAVELLLTARRIPTLSEECDLFIRNNLEPDEGNAFRSSALFSRAVFLFAMTMARLFADEQFGIDGDFQNCFEKLLIEALCVDPADVGTWNEHCDGLISGFQAHDRENLPQGRTLRAELTRSTYSVVGKSGYVRATISRIARRASCSPGGIYKAHHSKEDLVIGTFSDVILARWMDLGDIAQVLDQDYLTALLRSEASEDNERRRNFFLEVLLASGHNDILRKGVLRKFRDLEVSVSSKTDTDDVTRVHLRYLFRTLNTLVVATDWLASVTDSARVLDYNQIGEPMRRALATCWFPDWKITASELRNASKTADSRVRPAGEITLGTLDREGKSWSD
jgi:AcrR family transcriptional regulator